MIEQAKALLIRYKQEHLIPFLTEALAKQIIEIDFSILKGDDSPALQPLEPFTDYKPCGNLENIERGESLISDGAVGCLIVAGGQGTRLGVEGPKGAFPVSVIKNKSLFQLIAEKTLSAGKRVNRQLLLAIMTSPENDSETKDFFKVHHYFGLKSSQVSFFSQKVLPFLDKEGKLFLEQPDKIAEGPDGNGYVFKHFVTSGIWDKWSNQGVRIVNFILIDNPLADPWDAETVGALEKENSDVVIKAVTKEKPEEKVGMIVKESGKVKIIEYSELSEADANKRDRDGSLLFKCANIGLFAFSMNYIKRCSEIQLPNHLAFKAVRYLNAKGECVKSPLPNAWKFETFIFDLIPSARSVSVFLFPKRDCFAPLKNRSGPDSLETVKKALQDKDKLIYERITGKEPPEIPFELSQDFYYPTDHLLKKWKGVILENGGYVED